MNRLNETISNMVLSLQFNEYGVTLFGKIYFKDDENMPFLQKKKIRFHQNGKKQSLWRNMLPKCVYVNGIYQNHDVVIKIMKVILGKQVRNVAK